MKKLRRRCPQSTSSTREPKQSRLAKSLRFQGKDFYIVAYRIKNSNFDCCGSLVFPLNVQISSFDIDSSGLYLSVLEKGPESVDSVNIYQLATGVQADSVTPIALNGSSSLKISHDGRYYFQTQQGNLLISKAREEIQDCIQNF